MERNEAIEVIKRNYPHVTESGSQFETALRLLIPELKKDEGERIRKHLISLFEKFVTLGVANECETSEIKVDDILAWLEKQGEQKEYTFKSLPRLLDMIEPTSKAKAYCQKLIDTLVKEGYATDAKIVGESLKIMNGEDVPMAIMDEKQVEQKPAWSEEDEKQARQIERIVHDDGCTQKLQTQIADWFESLKERYTWKPSDEQMDALRYVTNFDYGGYKATLVSLYEQLKKLKG